VTTENGRGQQPHKMKKRAAFKDNTGRKKSECLKGVKKDVQREEVLGRRRGRPVQTLVGGGFRKKRKGGGKGKRCGKKKRGIRLRK